MLHVSDLSHGRVKKPADLVTIGQKLKVKITKIDEKTNRVSASVKALTEDPYANIEKIQSWRNLRRYCHKDYGLWMFCKT